ncbi:MAG: hypothetical protein ABH860_03995 [bacterium]
MGENMFVTFGDDNYYPPVSIKTTPQDIPTPDGKDRVPLGVERVKCAIYANKNQAMITSEIKVLMNNEATKLDSTYDVATYMPCNKQGNVDPKKEAALIAEQEKLVIGDRLNWNLKIAEKMVTRNFPADHPERHPKEEETKEKEIKEKEIKMSDREEACARFNKISSISKFSGKSIPKAIEAKIRQGMGSEDFYAYTEVQSGQRYFKEIPDFSLRAAYVGIASMILDEISMGSEEKDIAKLMGFKEVKGANDKALDLAIKYCVDARSVGRQEMDYYAIGKSYVTEAKLRALRRNLADGDTNDGIKKLLSEFINNYNLSANKTAQWSEVVPSQSVKNHNIGESWQDATRLSIPVTITKKKNTVIEVAVTASIEKQIEINPMVKRYKESDVSEASAVPLAKIGIVYLIAQANLEMAKLDMESNDSKEVAAAVKKAKQAEYMLTGMVRDVDADGRIIQDPDIEAIKTLVVNSGSRAIKDIVADAKFQKGSVEWIYANKMGDYGYIDAIISMTDLLQLYGSTVGGNKETECLTKCLALYETLDQGWEEPVQAKKEVPFKDIQARSIDAEINLKKMLEMFQYAGIDKPLGEFFGPAPTKVDTIAEFYKGSWQYYKVEFTWGSLLIERNKKKDKYPNEMVAGRLEGIKDAEEPIKDAMFAKCLALDIKQNIFDVKSTNPKGKIDLYFRACLLEARADARLLKWKTDEERQKDIPDIKKKLEDAIIAIRIVDAWGGGALAEKLKLTPKDINDKLSKLTQQERGKILGDEYAGLIKNGNKIEVEARKYREMDYPFYSVLYNELASVLEQEAIIATRKDRETAGISDEKLAAIIDKAFEPALDKYNKVNEICGLYQSKSTYDKYVRPQEIAIRKESIESLKINTIKRVGLGKIEPEIKMLDEGISRLNDIKLGNIPVNNLKPSVEKASLQPLKVDKVDIGVTTEDGPVTVLKEVAEGLYVSKSLQQINLISRKFFYISRQPAETESEKNDQTKQLLTLFKEADELADQVIKKVLDPYYVVLNLVGMAMVLLNAEVDGNSQRQMALDVINKYYAKYIKSGEDKNRVPSEMAEALAIYSAVNRMKSIAMPVVENYGVITGQTERSIDATKNAADKDYWQKLYNNKLAGEYSWKANMESWFYDDEAEVGSPEILAQASRDYQKAIDAYDKITQPNTAVKDIAKQYIPAVVNKAAVDYRVALINYKAALKNMKEEKVRTEAEKTKIEAAKVKLVESCRKALTMLKAVADIKPELFWDKESGMVVQVGLMTDDDVERRQAEFACTQVRANTSIRTIICFLRNLAEKDKIRVTDTNDNTDASMDTAGKTVVGTEAGKGDLLNKDQFAKVNETRRNYIDKDNKPVNLPPLIGENASWAALSLKQVNDIIGVLGESIADSAKLSGTLLAVADKYLSDTGGNARAVANKIIGKKILSKLELHDNGVDKESLDKTYISELAVLNRLLPEDAAIVEKFNGAMSLLGETDEGKTWKANVIGWVAMPARDIDSLKKAVGIYEQVKKPDADTLRNYGEALSMIYYISYKSDDRDAAIKILDQVAEKDRSTTGAMALNRAANLRIGSEALADKRKAREAEIKALGYATGIELPEGTKDASAYYLKLVQKPKYKQLLADRIVMESLSQLLIAEAWISTEEYKSDEDKGKLSKAYAVIQPKIQEVLELAKVFKNDRNMSTILHPKSPSGLVYVLEQLDLAYKEVIEKK